MIHQYLTELSRIRLLTPLEERSLWDRFKSANSREARQRLIEAYQPLVYKIASRIANREPLFFDLLQEGTVGLIEAVESFEPQQGVRFSTYAQYRIRGRMIDFLKRQRLNQEPLQLAIYEEEFEEFITKIADHQVNVEEQVALKLVNDQVSAAIDRLSPKEQKVIRDLYLLDKEPMVSAREMNISLSYFYKLQKKALHRLRGMLAKLRAEIKASG